MLDSDIVKRSTQLLICSRSQPASLLKGERSQPDSSDSGRHWDRVRNKYPLKEKSGPWVHLLLHEFVKVLYCISRHLAGLQVQQNSLIYKWKWDEYETSSVSKSVWFHTSNLHAVCCSWAMARYGIPGEVGEHDTCLARRHRPPDPASELSENNTLHLSDLLGFLLGWLAF